MYHVTGLSPFEGLAFVETCIKTHQVKSSKNQTHNLKVVGSNRTPATNNYARKLNEQADFLFSGFLLQERVLKEIPHLLPLFFS